MLSEVLNLNIFFFFVIFSRLAAAVTVMPGFSATYVSMRIRIAFIVVFSFVLVPVLQDVMPPIPASAMAMTLIFIGEAIIGLLIGSVMRILLGALQTAGTVIAFSSSMANAMIMDPISQQQSAVVSVALTTMATVIIFVADLHHLMIAAYVESYTMFVPGHVPPVSDIAQLIARIVADSFSFGIQLAAPFLLISFTYNVALGTLARLMPKLNVFFVGMPLSIGLAFAGLMICIPSILMIFLKNYEETIEKFFIP
ncbi:MAG: flagellar biosynthetic protein FliR [Alphaproteobacteria bacterium]|nr:flagellar biosynthetic protein FliR [Rhodospirillales bacterium]MCW9046099.1 flagellar biosynthetic protein FliR [Alphaproteobacteria bacterium]